MNEVDWTDRFVQITGRECLYGRLVGRRCDEPDKLSCWIPINVSVAGGAILALLILNAPALACRGPQSNRTILLEAIPPAAEGSEVKAKVEILEVLIRELPGLRRFHTARARVLQSVRGTADGQIVEIYTEPTSCGGGLDYRDVGRKGFIAGRFQPIAGEIFFSGSWTYGQIGKF
jgi:hypothetical protein